MIHNSKIKILVKQKTSRIEYAFDFICRSVLGVEFVLFDDVNSYKSSNGYGIRYGQFESDNVDNEYYIGSIGLLHNKEKFHSQAIKIQQIDGLPAFFGCTEASFPIDLPSCVFYLLSRSEEYESTKLDEHGRFQSKNSLARKNKFLEIPLLDLWIERLANSLYEFYPEMYIPFLHDMTRKGIVECTFDIDFPWAYRHRSLLSNCGGGLMDLFRGDLKGLIRRLQVILGISKDPYDQYELILNALAKYSLVPHFFILMQNNTKYDRNRSLKSKYFAQLIQKLATKSKVGLHPSYHVNESHDLLKKELISLTEHLSIGVRTSRMHFLKLKLPDTFNLLLDHGIYTDYSMGYADWPGFRSSTTYRHKWYDLSKDESTLLDIVPLIVMDTTLHSYLLLNPLEAAKKMKEMTKWVLKMKGNSSILWHNNGLSDWNHWKGWQHVFLEVIQDL